jgi:hypothetical protein
MNEKSLILPASIVQRRDRFIEDIEQQILNIDLFQEGELVAHKHFWVDKAGMIHFQLHFCDQPLELTNGDDLLNALTFDDLVEQLVVWITPWLLVQISFYQALTTMRNSVGQTQFSLICLFEAEYSCSILRGLPLFDFPMEIRSPLII